MRSPRAIYLLAFGAGFALAGVATFNFGRAFPNYSFRPLNMAADSYCLLGVLLIGSGAIMYVLGAWHSFQPQSENKGEANRQTGGALPAAILIGCLVVGVCLAIGTGGGSSSTSAGKELSPEEVVRLQTEMLQRQQEALKGMQPR